MVEMEVSLVGRDGVRGDTVREPVKLSEEMRSALSGFVPLWPRILGAPMRGLPSWSTDGGSSTGWSGSNCRLAA
jgi:hypothetical protein